MKLNESVEQSTDTTPNTTPEKPAPVTGIVEDPTLIPQPIENTLENWEVQNGKYGLAYLGIKEIGKTFPLNAQFSIIDKYIKGEMEANGYDKTPAKWQEILSELETEIGSSKLNAYERLKKLSAFVNIIKKQKALTEKRKLYQFISD